MFVNLSLFTFVMISAENQQDTTSEIRHETLLERIPDINF